MTELMITSSVLILVVIVLRHFLKGKISLRLQYALWALVLLRLLVPVTLFESPFSVMNAVQAAKSAREVSVASAPTPTLSSAYGDMGMENAAVPGGEEQNVTHSVTNVTHYVFHWGLLAQWVWVIGIGIVGMTLLLSNFSFGRKLRKTRKAYQADDCKLPVYVVEALPSPCLFGLFRPSIYITPEVAGDETKLRHVLAHEVTHYYHGDHIWAALRGLCLAVHWYTPLVWLAAALSRRDSELACDEGTIKRIGEGSRMEYGRTLIGLTCEKRKAMDLLCCATTMTDGKKGIKERITLIAKKPKLFIPAVIAVVLVAAVAVGCTFTGAKNDAEIVPLSADELTQYNKAFEPLLYDGQGNPSVNPLSNFLTSYYDRLEDINLAELLRYFPSDGDVTDRAEFESLKVAENWPFGTDVTLDGMPVPIHKFSADTVNKALKEYMGITLEGLSGVGADELIYLKAYDAYYNFTSDFGTGIFVCTSGETQGDIIRLYGKNTTLTLNMQGDGFWIVSHQRTDGNAEEETNTDSGTEGASVSVRVEAEGNIPGAVIDYATEYVAQQVVHYNEAGKDLPSDLGTYAITDAKITGLTQVNTGTAGLTSGVNMYLLEYRLRPDKPDNVLMAGGMRMEETDGESWITEWGSAGQPYLLLAWDDTGTETLWRHICVTTTDTITQDYGTPEMLERYGNEFTAAAMELYHQFTNGNGVANGIGLVLDGIDVPDDVLSAAKAQVAGYYETACADHSDHKYVNWRIESLERAHTYDDLDGLALDIYRMNYEFLSEAPETVRVAVAGGMYVTDDGWVCPTYPNCTYLIFSADDGFFFRTIMINDCSPGDELFTSDLSNLRLSEAALKAAGVGEAIASADINRDDKNEKFYLDTTQMTEHGLNRVMLRLYNDRGYEIWSEDAYLSHTGWDSLFLCELDGEPYLLRYNPAMFQGYCDYTYTLFTLEGGTEKVYQTNTQEFDINGTKSLDASDMVAFADEVNALLEKSTLLVSSKDGAFTLGPASSAPFLETYSWLDGFPELDLYAKGDNLATRLQKYSDYAVSNYARMN